MEFFLSPDETLALKEFFDNPENQHRFWQQELPGQKTVVLILAILVLSANFIFSFSDFSFHSGLMLQIHAGLRIAFGISTVMLIAMLRNIDNEKKFNRAVFAWILTAIALTSFIDFYRPRGGFSYYFVDMLTIFGIYSGVPLSLTKKHICAIAITLNTVLIIVLSGNAYTRIEMSTFILTFSIANILGSIVSVRYEKGKKHDFFMAEREKQLRVELEKSISEIKVLQGLLPICSWCKKIKVNEDEWEQLETYVSNNSEAKFSHGVCPKCRKKISSQTVEAMKKK